MNTRAFYRVVFPIDARPRLQVENQIFPVLDCSEQGLRIQADESRRPAREAVVRGRVCFPTGEEHEVSGVVLRHTPDGAALYLSEEGIPFATVLRLQLYLRRRFVLADGGAPLAGMQSPAPALVH